MQQQDDSDILMLSKVIKRYAPLFQAYQEKSSGREEERVKQCSGEYLSQAEGHAAQVHRSNHHVTTDATSHKYKHDLTFINAEQPSNAESVISTPVNNTQKGNTSAENKVGEVTRGDKATQQVEATINDIIHGKQRTRMCCKKKLSCSKKGYISEL